MTAASGLIQPIGDELVVDFIDRAQLHDTDLQTLLAGRGKLDAVLDEEAVGPISSLSQEMALRN